LRLGHPKRRGRSRGATADGQQLSPTPAPPTGRCEDTRTRG